MWASRVCERLTRRKPKRGKVRIEIRERGDGEGVPEADSLAARLGRNHHHDERRGSANHDEDPTFPADVPADVGEEGDDEEEFVDSESA